MNRNRQSLAPAQNAGTNPAARRLRNSAGRGTRRSGGFSLLEVILALAILTGAIAVLGEAARLGMRNARIARDTTRAQLLCESKMAEITAGITPAVPVSPTAFDRAALGDDTTAISGDDDVTWFYSIETENLDEEGLMAVGVTVTQDLTPEKRLVAFKLVRWILGSATETPAESVGEESE